MNSDAIVSTKDVLTAAMEVRRIGRERALQELEAIEPDLTEYALEELSSIHTYLGETTITAKEVRRLTRRIEEMVLVLITSLRKARLRLWQEPITGDVRSSIPASADPSPPAPQTPHGRK